MANSKKTTKSSSSSSSSRWGLNKISFWTIVAITFLFALSLIFSAIGGKVASVTSWLMCVAEAILTIIVAILAWRYVRSKPFVWKVLYVICLLVVIAGIIVPRVL